MRKLLFLFLFVLLFLHQTTQSASAHIGGGPPFLKVNDTYAQTNPYFFNDPSITIPQDSSPDRYLVHTPIHFQIDTDKLLVPPDVATRSTFRWTLSENSKGYIYGTDFTHIYTKPQSYLVSVEVQAPGETEYILLDTVQVDVLPNQNYKLPTSSIAIETTQRLSDKPVLFKSDFHVDPSATVASVIWGFGDQETAKEKTVLHTYRKLIDYTTFPVIFRVIDSNHFIKDTGIIIESLKGKLHVLDTNGKENPIPVADTITTQIKNNQNNTSGFTFPLLLVGICVIIILLLFVFVNNVYGKK